MSLRGFYWLPGLVLLISIMGIYLFIPSPIRVSKQLKIKGSERDLYALMSNREKAVNWLNNQASNPEFRYHFLKNSYPAIFIEARSYHNIIPIEIKLQDLAKTDSTILSWDCAIPAGLAPWSRVQHYWEARQLKEDFSRVMDQFTRYAGDTKNWYGITISETVVKDTLIATLSRFVSTPPSTALGCDMINELRQQLTGTGLSITDSAMTLVSQAGENNKYKVMVGFPVNKIPGSNSNLVIKKMIPGKLLTGTVYGGPAAIRAGHEQMRKYIMDHNREEVAMPYEVSVINRCAAPDTTKWITKISYPVY